MTIPNKNNKYGICYASATLEMHAGCMQAACRLHAACCILHAGCCNLQPPAYDRMQAA